MSALGRLALASLACFALTAQAQSQAPTTSAAQGSTAADGATIASQGAGGAPCASCHGAHGEGNAQGNFPRLAAQPAGYLTRQLDLYASGQRQSTVMQPIAQALKAEQRVAVARYYASLDTPTATKTAAPNDRSVAQLVTYGDARRGIQGCVNCHGPQGRGEAPEFPALAAQIPSYLSESLTRWKSGERKTDPSQQMNHIAANLSEPEIAALARYFASLPAPAPFPSLAPPEAAASAAPSTGPTTAEPKQGVGIEQGGPTTGGAQGQGAGGTATGNGPTGSSTSGSTP